MTVTPPHQPAGRWLIRDSRDDDVAAIQAIYAHHVAQGKGSFELDAPTHEEVARRRADVLANGFPFLVAESAVGAAAVGAAAVATAAGANGRVAGYAYANFFRMRPAYRFTVEDSIYIEPAAAGQGVGKLLLTALLQRCEAAGCRQMLAVIGDSGNTGSIGLHARCGFRFAGVLRSTGWKFDQWLDTVLMQKDLGPGDRTPAP